MKDEDRKILTEFLGEKWHERIWRDEIGKPATLCSCGFDEGVLNLCVHLDAAANRTFDTWEDFGALWDRVKKTKGWRLFISKLYYAESSHHAIEANDYPGYIDVIQVDKDRFPFLILEAIKEGILR